MKLVRIASITVCAALLMVPFRASAQVTVFDPSNFIKNSLNEAHLTISVQQQVQQILQETLTRIAAQESNTQMSQMLAPVTNQVWSNSQQNLTKILSLVNTAHNISVSDTNIDPEFKALYPDYVPTANYTALLQAWDVNTKRAAQDTMNVAGLSIQDIKGQTAITGKNRTLVANAQGNMQVMQATATMAEQQVEQLQKLQALDAYRSGMEAEYYMKASAESTNRQVTQKAMQNWVQYTAKPSAALNLPPL